MFSNDRNIETIGQLFALIKRSIGLQKEYLKLDITEKTVKLITALLLFAIFTLIFVTVIIFLSFTAAFAMAPHIGNSAAFSIIAGFYFIIFILLLIFKKSWIERPLVRFITSLLMEK